MGEEPAKKEGGGPPNNNNNNNGNKRFQQHRRTDPFKGAISDLGDAVFIIASSSGAVIYKKSLKSIMQYVSLNITGGLLLSEGMRGGALPDVDVPKPPKKIKLKDGEKWPIVIDDGTKIEDEEEAENIYYMRKLIWEKALKKAINKKEEVEEGNKKLFALLTGQCSPAMVTKLEGSPGYNALYTAQDGIGLLETIRSIMCGVEQHLQPTWSIVSLLFKFVTFHQKGYMSNSAYKDEFESLVTTLEDYGGLPVFPNLLAKKIEEMMADGRIKVAKGKEASVEDKALAIAECKQEYLACMMLMGANHERFGVLKDGLYNDMVKGKDNYPKTPETCLDYMNNYKGPRAPARNHSGPREELQFAQEGEKELKTNKSGKSNCFHCNDTDHWAAACPLLTDEEKEQLLADRKKQNRKKFEKKDGEQHYMQGAIVNGSSFFVDSDVFQADLEPQATSEEEQWNHLAEYLKNKKEVLGEIFEILLDNCSTYNSCTNENMLENVHQVHQYLIGRTNAGTTKTNHMGDFTDMGDDIPFWYDQGGMANVLSLPWLEKEGYHVKYDSDDPYYLVSKNGMSWKFYKNENGMPSAKFSKKDGMQFIQTIRDNCEGYTKKEVEKAQLARKASALLGSPSDRDLKYLVSTQLDDCPITVHDVTRANSIYGPDLKALRGKTVRNAPEHVQPDYVEIPKDFLLLHRSVTLVADVMFVNNVPFLITMSRGIKFITVEHVKSRTAKQLSRSLVRIMQLYSRGSMIVQTILMDMEFDSTVNELMGKTVVNTSAAKEHVAEIERCIRTVKERCRGIAATLPYKCLHKMIVTNLVYFAVLWLNAFPVKNGVSNVHSPRAIVIRTKLSWKQHCVDEFGSYTEVHDEPDPSNTMVGRTHGAILLGPTGNINGTHKFFCLKTARILKRRKWTALPMSDSTIARVEQWGAKTKREVYDNALEWRDRNKQKFEWDPEDDIDHLLEDDNNSNDNDSPHSGTPAEFPGVPLQRDLDALLPPPDAEVDADNTNAAADIAAANAVGALATIDELETDENEDLEVIDPAPEPGLPATDSHTTELDVDDDHTNMEEVELPLPGPKVEANVAIDNNELSSVELENNETQNDHDRGSGEEDTEETALSEDTGVRRSNRQPKRKKVMNPSLEGKSHGEDVIYGAMHAQLDQWAEQGLHTKEEQEEYIMAIIMVQYSVKKGLEVFGERGEKAVSKELHQFHDMNVFSPLDAAELSYEQRKKALASLMFLKEKRNGDVKARKCVVGTKQREYIKKEDAASPTVTTEAVLITGVIEAMEERDVAVCDIPSAFLHTESDEDEIMVLEGPTAELMVAVDPKLYRKYITYNKKGKPVLYVKIQKAIYGMLRSALLFYRKLVGDLEAYGFEVNPYDPCVANKMVAGSQMTVTWHVDDLKVSHKSAFEVTRLMAYLDGLYPGLVVHRGKKHDYLGINLDYSVKGKLVVDQIPYLIDTLREFPEELGASAATPAKDHLFQIRPENEAVYLPEEQAQTFHRMVAKLLFASSRSRRDIQTAVSFLTSRVKKPDEDDWGKLRRVLKYIKGTLGLKLTLSAENLSIIKWWADASYGVHEDMKGHSGGMMSLGTGAVVSSSNKQKLNVKSSTEGEIVGADDILPKALWSKNFIEAQGYTVDQMIMYQDNQSAMLLETNGKFSSSSRTKHIKARYYFIKDCIERGELSLEWCPTEEMWADVLTKPQQGLLFRQMRAVLMGCAVNWVDDGTWEDTDKIAGVRKPKEGATWLTTALNNKTMKPVSKATTSPQECVGVAPQ